MNVTCTSCPAKYAVPDEKVRGKKVRITCKHCGTSIVVDGTTMGGESSAQPAPAATPARAPEPATLFVVGFPDDRQETHSVAEIVDRYIDGRIDDEVLVWRDGMPDWLSLFEVPEIAAAFRKRSVAPRKLPLSDDEPTVVGRSPLEDEEAARRLARLAGESASALLTENARAVSASPGPISGTSIQVEASVEPAEPASSPAASSPGASSPGASSPAAPSPGTSSPAASSPPVAARRAQLRPAGVDLFGAVAEAGAEHDPSLHFPSSDDRAHKLTGARNESSVLFSLDALTKGDARTTAPKRASDRDKDASAALFGESAPDSLLNLGGGGFSALAAPDFTRPVSDFTEPARSAGPVEVPNQPPVVKHRGGVILLVASLVGIAAIAAGAFVMMKKPSLTAVSEPSPSSSSTTSVSEVGSNAAQPAAEQSAAAASPTATSSAAEASASAKASGTPPPWGQATPSAANKAVEPTASKKADASPSAPAPTPATPAEPTPAAAAEGAAFDKSAAVAALGAAAASAASCKRADGPTGTGKVSVTFAPSGRATATTVAGDLAGTEVGGCVARLFRSAKVPPFSGDPVTVSKSFAVE